MAQPMRTNGRWPGRHCRCRRASCRASRYTYCYCTGRCCGTGGGTSVELTASSPCLEARVSGEMDYLADLLFRRRFKNLIARGDRCIVLDLARVSFCDSAGPNLLLGTWKQANATGGELVPACVPEQVRRILQMTAADSVLRVLGVVADAEAAFGG
ncbi:STAS domain-containing protein [Streptomyces sp. NPDC005813]|uniref:STAS domain-containing protein n=1 Tax=Streptomyces sp. NPDC005813 TaxID=3155592 RepID=UPI0033D7D9C2